MSFPIIPPSSPSDPQSLSVPTTTSGSNPAASAAPVDFFAPSIAQSLAAPPFDASNPRLSIADFYGSISSANLSQKLREYLDDLNDPLFRKELMKFAAEQASYMAEVITLVYKYDSLNMQLGNLDLPGKANRINNKLNIYGSGTTNDNIQIHILNAAGTTYNAAQSTYQNALINYQTALNTFESAQTTYNTALNAWNIALSAFQNGTLTQAQLESARTTFQNASNQFDNAKTSFASAQTTFNAAKTNWNNAVSTYSAAVSNYNAYAASRGSDLNAINDAINDWNSAYATASTVIAQMNSIRQQLGLAAVSSTGMIATVNGLSIAIMPNGPSTIRNAVQADIDQDNALRISINSTTGVIGGKVTTINAGGYTPPLTTPATITAILGLPTTDSDNNAPSYPDISIPPSLVISTPANEDLITTYLLPRIAILFEIKDKTTKEDLFRADTDNPPIDQVSGKSIISAGSGGSALGLANATGIAASPFLSAILSKHAFESILNVYGVPAGSPLVDQLGSLYTQIETNAGLASAGPASQILDNAVLTGANGKTAIDAAVALGNLSVVKDVAVSDEFRDAIKVLIEKDPALASLTAEQKTALLDGLVGEMGASLMKSALNEVARALGLPGLTPQILAILAGLTEHDPLASFSQQLYRNVLFAQEIAKEFQISDAEANQLIETAIRQQITAQASPIVQAPIPQTPKPSAQEKPKLSVQEPLKPLTQQTAPQPTNIENAPPQLAGDPVGDAIAEKAVIEKSVTDQLIKTGLVRVEVEQKVQRASTVASDGVRQEQLKSDIAKASAFKASLLKSFAALELDPVKADLLAAQIPVGPINEVTKILVDKGLTLPEANQVATTALSAAERNDPVRNPLSSFIIQQMGTSTELAGLLKGQIINTLSPAVGMRTALDVAENYGSLIFSSANSITNILQVNERRLDAISYFIHDVRINENYREATISYRSPELDPQSPLKLGKTLLLAGIPGGLSNQGLTSQDNTLGPSAGQSKHATSYPGIFG